MTPAEVVEAQFSPKPGEPGLGGGRKSVDVLKLKLTKDAQFKAGKTAENFSGTAL